MTPATANRCPDRRHDAHAFAHALTQHLGGGAKTPGNGENRDGFHGPFAGIDTSAPPNVGGGHLEHSRFLATADP